MEFLRFGSSIPGAYWGCCAMCIIQDFKQDPADKYAIEIVDGDGGIPMGGFLGMTYEEVFMQRLRIGTFSTSDMPNHGFLAILADWQISSGVGLKWLKILKREGFEFIRTVTNSVYDGQSVLTGKPHAKHGHHPNYVFGLFRNVGKGACANPYEPPQAWKNLDSVVPETWELYADKADAAYADNVRLAQMPLYKALPKPKLHTIKAIREAGIEPTMAGRRSTKPQQSAKQREQVEEAEAAKTGPKTATVNPFNG